MSKIILYIATSIDGYIAKENGNVDWLNEIPNPNNIDYGYEKFYSEIDIVIMGRKSYEEILGFDVEWPYSNNMTYVVSSNTNLKIKTENTKVLSSLNLQIIDNLREKSKKNIWLLGGGNLVSHFIDLKAIDEMQICIIPTVLGNGIKLFPNNPQESKFNLVETNTYETGVVCLKYAPLRQL